MVQALEVIAYEMVLDVFAQASTRLDEGKQRNDGN
jgi:hypothetical protein